MSKKRLLLLLVLPFLFTGLWSFSSDDRYFEIAKNLDIFSSLYSEVNTYYVDDINPNKLIKTSIDAMLKKLDPYTVYIPEDDIEDYRTNSTGKYSGIGILSNKVGQKHLVLNLYTGSPAEKAGIKIGDEIVDIDGLSIKKMSDEEVGKLIKGQSGTSLAVGIERNGSDYHSFDVERKNITIPNISYQTLLDDEIGYFKMTEFTRNASQDIKSATLQLKSQGAQYLVFDLRGNPGGLLNEAVGICNLFVPKGSKIVETRGKTKAQSLSYSAKNDPLDLEIPIVVLIDQNSASASEIVSGVIQDYDRGVIIGQKSFGKGLVQVTRPLSYKSQLKVTTAKYYIPSGRCIQELDYQNKDENGRAIEIPDSLTEAFFTANNRVVYDGGGVDPDIKTEKIKTSSYTENLSNSGIIFEYATKYYYENDTIQSAVDFQLTDQEYDAFSDWVTTQDFESSSNSEKAIKVLSLAAENDKVYAQLTDEIERISTKIKELKTSGLTSFRSEIKRKLELEILRRYYLNEGVLEATLHSDPDVIEAMKVLKDESRYKNILNK